MIFHENEISFLILKFLNGNGNFDIRSSLPMMHKHHGFFIYKGKKMKHAILAIISLLILCSCAAGSAVSAYSLQSRTSEGLTAEAESSLIERLKNEINY